MNLNSHQETSKMLTKGTKQAPNFLSRELWAYKEIEEVEENIRKQNAEIPL